MGEYSHGNMVNCFPGNDWARLNGRAGSREAMASLTHARPRTGAPVGKGTDGYPPLRWGPLFTGGGGSLEGSNSARVRRNGVDPVQVSGLPVRRSVAPAAAGVPEALRFSPPGSRNIQTDA